MTTKCTVLSRCWADTLPAPLGKQEGLGWLLLPVCLT